MPEKFGYQEYRDNLARQIKDEPDKGKRREILEGAKETTEYKNAESEKRDSSEITEQDFETQPKDFLEFRKNSSSSINNEICEKFFNGNLSDEELQTYFQTDPDTTKAIKFVLESFAKPQDPSKARRKDGSHIAVHSLQLFKTGRDYLKISDPDILKTVLVHDIIEDTKVSEQEINDQLGERTAQLANLMTEERVHDGTTELDKADLGRLDIVRFIKKLQSGGDVIAAAEAIDRADDISDLAYLTNKLAKNPEDKNKVKQALIAKFGKCQYTVDQVTKGSTDNTVQRLKEFFQGLVSEQLSALRSQFGVEVTTDEIQEEWKRYDRLQDLATNKN